MVKKIIKPEKRDNSYQNIYPLHGKNVVMKII